MHVFGSWDPWWRRSRYCYRFVLLIIRELFVFRLFMYLSFCLPFELSLHIFILLKMKCQIGPLVYAIESHQHHHHHQHRHRSFIFHAFSHTVSMSFTATTQSMLMPNALFLISSSGDHFVYFFENVKTTHKNESYPRNCLLNVAYNVLDFLFPNKILLTVGIGVIRRCCLYVFMHSLRLLYFIF